MTEGAWGESVAKAYLERKGYECLDTNFHTRYGEIDIIAAHDTYIVFVEVKTRRRQSFALAREAVTWAKQQKILLAAEEWLQQNPTPLQPRFDVIEVYGTERCDRLPIVNHFEDAFGG